MKETYPMDTTKPPLSVPDREFHITLLGKRETIESRRKMVEYEQYITAYHYMQAIEERKNNEKA